MFCSDWSLVKTDPHQATIIPLRCRCWTCPECAPHRKARLIHEAKNGRPNVFITLTVRRRAHWPADYAARRLAAAWRIVRAEFLRKHGPGTLPFLCVFEKTKKGYPHLHIVARCKWIEQKWLSNRMKALIDSPVVDVRRVYGTDLVEHYISKYISKDPTRFDGTKRYWRSQDYLDPIRATLAMIQPHPETWEIVKDHWRTLAARLEGSAGTITVFRNHAVYERPVPP